MKPMRLSKRQIQNPDLIIQTLEDCDVLRLGLTDEEGMFIVPVNFGYEICENTAAEAPLTASEKPPAIRLYFHSAAQGRKADALAKNPRAAIEMDCAHQLITGDYSCNYSYAYRSIMGSGTVRLLTEKEEKIHGLNLIMKHVSAAAPVSYKEESLNRVNVYCIEEISYTGKMREQKK